MSRKTTVQLQPALQGQESRDLSQEWFALLESPTVGTQNCIQNSMIFGLRPGKKNSGQGGSLSDWTTRRLEGRMPLVAAANTEVPSTVFPIVEIEKSFAGDATIGAAGFLHKPLNATSGANCALSSGNTDDLFPVGAELTIGTQEEAILPLRVGPSIRALATATVSSVPVSEAEGGLYGLTQAQVSGTNSDQDFDRWAIAVLPAAVHTSYIWRLRYQVNTSSDGPIIVHYPNQLASTYTSPPYNWNRILSPGIENTLFVLGCSYTNPTCLENPNIIVPIKDQFEGSSCRNSIGIRVTTIVYDSTTETYSAKAYPSTFSSTAATNTCGVDP